MDVFSVDNTTVHQENHAAGGFTYQAASATC